ncbi:MAG: carbon storage regulator CsrA [Ruminobacter sp.]|jgi:carbon storage regulator|uniref:Translational regulator CsrA n=1 Tax=Ruminobacter amylophilus TaxID=867 RepID=A0A662ZLR9_9GAMM|nr:MULTISPECIES: carbon storage regulator CsrA [Ruminobacter]MBQ3775233.1 carbon storage regulator CsrA [Ruminobacter sp.]SFP55217.1 carbon storage regulator, CsrA [Ruminobacter amylophilus]
MLILTRRLGEAITIGKDVKLTVLSIKGNQVRIGVDAPKEVSIQRSELIEKKENEENSEHADIGESTDK